MIGPAGMLKQVQVKLGKFLEPPFLELSLNDTISGIQLRKYQYLWWI